MFAAGSIPPELQRLWSELSEQRVEVDLYNRHGHGEQGVPDMTLQLVMLADLFDFEPATAVLLTGDGAGYDRMVGFHNTLERMFLGGWRVEVMAWGSCNTKMGERIEYMYIPLDSWHFQ